MNGLGDGAKSSRCGGELRGGDVVGAEIQETAPGVPQTDIDGVEPRDAAHDAHDVVERGGDESSDIQLRSQRERPSSEEPANGPALHSCAMLCTL